MINDTNREKIKDAAVKLVLAEGIFYPTTAEITLAAGVSRTLLHYYFKDKYEIQEFVTSRAMALHKLKMQQLYIDELSVKERVIEFSEMSFELSLSYPYLDIFMVTSARENQNVSTFLNEQNLKLKPLLDELECYFSVLGTNVTPAYSFLLQLIAIINISPDAVINAITLREHTNSFVPAVKYKSVLRKMVEELLAKYSIN